jgi:4-alpha-glucanotransferase
MADGDLERLARAHDVMTSYWDLEGNEVFARPESLVAALRGMGVIEDAGDVAQALRAHEMASWRWWAPPVVVAWGSGASNEQPSTRTTSTTLRIRIPERVSGGAGLLRLELEDGGVIEREVRLPALKVAGTAEVEGERFVEVPLRLPAGLPLGYHRLSVEVAGRQMHSWVIAAPRNAYAAEHGPAWGVFLPLYALHSKRSWGIGDYSDLKRLIEWAGGKGASVVATLPLLPAFLDNPFASSPYEPVSRLFWSEVFIDPEGTRNKDHGTRKRGQGERDRGQGTADGRLASLAKKARGLLDMPDVDYAAVMAMKREALEAQAQSLEPGSATAEAMEAYLASRLDVRDYAAFRAAVERLGPDWREWPARQRNGELRPEDYDEGAARYYEYAQWLAHSQMQETGETAAALGLRSYLDLPVGVHPQGYDAWRYRQVFAQGLTVGAPPDLLASNGQNWGFQPLLPAALRESGYDYMVRYLRHYFDSAKMLRIDHAIGLHRLYWIPDGATARDGVFVRQPSEELYAVICLESVRSRAVVIAEDLGLVPPEVGRGLKAHGISDTYVQMFEMTGRTNTPLRRPRAHSVASFGTHDLPAFAAYWRDEDLSQRETLGLLTPERAAEESAGRTRERKALLANLTARGLVGDETDVGQVFRGSTALLAESEAEWVMLNLEDTWGETRQQNLPGTTSDQHSNWVARAAYGLEAFDSVEGLTKAIETVRLYRRTGKRARKGQGQTAKRPTNKLKQASEQEAARKPS